MSHSTSSATSGTEGLTISVCGLGYVGLPLALAFARKVRVVAYDVKADRIEALQAHADPAFADSRLDDADIEFTSNPAMLAQANFHIIAAPTPVRPDHTPDLAPLFSAIRAVGSHMKRGDTVVIESTVHPGCTERECLPIIEEASGLKADTDFSLAYSPERINPGDGLHTLATVTKVVAARTPSALERVAGVYSLVAEAGVYRAGSIMEAEAAKIIENTQRDVNIALMNEFAMIMGRLGVDTRSVIRAASTKWNFTPFTPGLVGGHCIGVDPYYLIAEARRLGCEAKVMEAAREVNESVGAHVARQVIKMLLAGRGHVSGLRALILGMAYKADVADVRGSQVPGMVAELKSFGLTDIDVVDPVASKRSSAELYGFEPQDAPDGLYDAVVIATPHSRFADPELVRRHAVAGAPVADIYGILADTANLNIWRL